MRVIEEIPACLSMMLLRSPNGRIQNEDDREKASPKMEGGFLRESVFCHLTEPNAGMMDFYFISYHI